MIKRSLNVTIVFAVSFFLISTFTYKAWSQELKKVTVRLHWTYYGHTAPLFLTLDKGWYRDSGLDLEIKEGRGSADTVKVVAGGADTFGIADLASMAVGVSKGMPLKAVAGIVNRNPLGVMVREDSGIKTAKDLEGKSVSVTTGGSDGALLPAFFKAASLDPKKIKIVSTDASAKNRLMLEKKVDGATTTYPVVPLLEDVSGVKVVSILWADYGVTTISDGLFTRTDLISENPDIVKRFVKASLKGYLLAKDKPEEAVAAAKKFFPKFKESVALDSLKINYGLHDTDNTKGKPFGWMSEKDWALTLDLLNQYGLMEKKLDPSAYYTNEFVDAK